LESICISKNVVGIDESAFAGSSAQSTLADEGNQRLKVGDEFLLDVSVAFW
jgi:hypothetical protein